MSDYPWYKMVEGPDLEQGDLFEKLLFFTPRDEDPSKVEIIERDVIVMTQSSDIIERKVDHLIFCPIYQLEPYSTEVDSSLQKPDKRNTIVKGRVVQMYMLNRCELPGYERDFWLVNFSRILEMSALKVINHARECGPRPRLLPPYREHLAQAFARFFMRIGLPEDIPSF